MQRKIRVLVGKPGLDGHDRGAKVVAAALRDAGMEVIYTGLHQSPEQVVEAAVQEDVDVVALSILSGAHMTLFPDVHELMKQRGIGDRLLTGGGIIPPEDMGSLAKLGVGKLFGPGSSTQDIAHYIREWFMARHGADALAPMPAPPAARAAAYPEVPRPAHARPAGAARPAAVPRRAAPKRATATRRGAAKRAAPKRATAKRSSGARAARGAARAKSRRRR
jgi:methylmalonyl-CoA mutase C-terminal domain/subunit